MKELSFVSSALPIGVNEVTPLEMATVQATLTNGGVRNDPYVIERIEDVDGTVLYQHVPMPVVAVDSDVACQTMQVLARSVRGGAAQAADLGGRAAAGQRGFTGWFLDSWFVGSTPSLATAVWIGPSSSNRTAAMTPEPGLADPAATWRQFNEAVHADLPAKSFDGCS